ncbi:MAG TPA: DUF6067 family protein, partial [Syntrophomonas sp.]|nr:DUF6067 family protein [Syntrophomonas sp.]
MLSLRLIEEGGQIHDFTNVLPIEKRVYGWENNTYGKEKIIIPPFIPVDASQNQISLLQRKHTVNSAGLWDSLLIQGREMLAAPMFWKLSVDGHDQVLQGKTPGFSVLDGGCSAEAVCVAQAADGTVLKSSIKFEYDGFFWSEVTLDQVGGKSIDRLTLVIPLKDAEVPLFHAIANTIRSNPGGSLPPGEGEIWNGAKLVRPSTSIHPQLVPHIWLGGIERGLAWFVDTSFGFRMDRKNSALRIIRKNDTVFLEIDVINRKVMLSDQHRFAFGMQATPVKPVEKEWRRIVYDAYGNGINGMINAQCLNEDMLGYYFRWSKEPAEGDFSLLESMARIARGDDMTEVAGLQEQYRSRHDPKWLGLVEATPKPSANQNYLAHFKSVRTAFVNLSYGADHIPSLPYKYSDPRLISMMDEVPQYFQSEWWINNTNYFGGWRSYPVPSNIDYMVYGYYH